MKMKRIAVILTALAIIAALAGCAPAKPVSSGAFDGVAYANDYFGLSFAVPDSWVIYSKQEMVNVLAVGTEQIGSEDKEAEKTMDLGEQELLYLAYATNHAADYMDGNIIDFCVIAEKFNAAVKVLVKNGKDYAELAIKNNKESNQDYNASEVTTETINGVEYGVFEVLSEMDGYEMRQRFYCTVKNGYALLFTMNYFEDAEMNELQPILDSISFAK